jgi:nitroimidazol reductase NimA-like FMN-containing flavoprotein (pyridoxamine 5'-phosphate oxidase superfamily)
MSSRGLEILDNEACEALLAGHNFGRIVAKVGPSLGAYPVYYAWVDGAIVMRTDPGTKLAAAVLHTRVVFEVDSEAEGWSVMAFGFAEELRRPSESEPAIEALGDYWPVGERLRVVRIRPERVTGRRLRDVAMAKRRAEREQLS